jgi:hypothetical protein
MTRILQCHERRGGAREAYFTVQVAVSWCGTNHGVYIGASFNQCPSNRNSPRANGPVQWRALTYAMGL